MLTVRSFFLLFSLSLFSCGASNGVEVDASGAVSEAPVDLPSTGPVARLGLSDLSGKESLEFANELVLRLATLNGDIDLGGLTAELDRTWDLECGGQRCTAVRK